MLHKFVLLLLLFLQNATAATSVNIVTMGFAAPDSMASLAWSGPALEVGVEKIKSMYNETFNFTLTYVGGKSVRSCIDIHDVSQELLAKWYYTEREEKDITVFLTPGCFEAPLVENLATMWNILFITSVWGVSNANVKRNPTKLNAAYACPSQCTQLVIRFLRYYNWTSLYIVIDTNSPPFYAAMAQDVTDITSGSSRWQTKIVEIASKSPAGVDYPALLDDFSSVSRVLLFYGHATVLRKLLVNAALFGMTNGEYVYFTVEATKSKELYGDITWEYLDKDDLVAKVAFQSLFILQPLEASVRRNEHYRQLGQEFLQRSIKDYNFRYSMSRQPFSIIASSYAVVQALAEVLNGSSADFDLNDGTQLANLFLNRSFHTDIGKVYFDSNGERQNDMMLSRLSQNSSDSLLALAAFDKKTVVRLIPSLFDVLKLHHAFYTKQLLEYHLIRVPVDDQHGSGQPFVVQLAHERTFVQVANICWPGDNWPPPNEPLCGYRHQRDICNPQKSVTWIYGTGCGILAGLVIMFSSFAIIIRRRHGEPDLNDWWWQVNSQELLQFSQNTRSRISVRRRASLFSSPTEQTTSGMFTVGHCLYNSTDVFVQLFRQNLDAIDVTALAREKSANKELMRLLHKIRELSHENINHLVGITIFWDPENKPHPAFVSGYAVKGSINDLFASSVHMDWNITGSLLLDFLQGLEFIHKSELHYHGQLSSSKCVVDKYLTLKLTQLAFERVEKSLTLSVTSAKKTHSTVGPENEARSYWAAPELLTKKQDPSQKTDIFAGGVIMFQIMSREQPYKNTDSVAPDGFTTMLSESMIDPLYFARNAIPEKLQIWLKQCWVMNPSSRPTATALKEQLQQVLSTWIKINLRVKLVDKIRIRLERYAADLETEVGVRTQQLISECQKCDALLAEILPVTIVTKLREGHKVEPEVFDWITLLFSDLVGFLPFVARSAPLTVTETLMDVESTFDNILEQFHVYKVEAVNDTYMVASGVPVRNGSKHVEYICSFALGMQQSFSTYSTVEEAQLQLRIGIHTGPCVAGIMGLRRPRYCLFGDTVNTASRMCSHGEPEKIHMSPITASFLGTNLEFRILSRGVIPIKGKTDMHTYWLIEQMIKKK